MAKKQIFERTNQIQDYLTQLEELLKKNKGTGLYEAYDVNPRAFRLPGRVVDPSGLGQDRMNDPVKFAPYDQSTIPFDAPNLGQVPQYQFEAPRLSPDDGSSYAAPPTPQGSGMKAEEFLDTINQVMSVPVTQSSDGGVIYSDGSVRYQDGTSRQVDQSELPKPLFQLSNGAFMFNDGVARRMTYTLGRAYQGVSGLSDLLFGQQQTVTQPYGNVNPIEPTPGNINYGTDFRTRDLPTGFNFALPFDVKVLAKTEDDGTRFGTMSGHAGYGNSIYLELPNGAILHLSHLSDMVNIQPGQVISAYDYIGTPGTSGNTYGEHLDLEFLDENLRPLSPDQFFMDAQQLINYDELEKAQTVSQEELAQLPPEERQAAEAVRISVGSEWQPAPPAEQVVEQQPILPQVGQAVAQGIDTANLTGDFDLGISEMFAGDPEAAKLAREETIQKYSPIEAELGFSEGLITPEAKQARISALSQQPKTPYQERDLFGKVRQLGGNIMERVGDRLGIPEGSFSEAIAGGATKRTNQAMADEIGGERPEQVPGIRQNIQDIGQDINQKVIQPVVAKAGEGIDFLKEKATNIFQKTPLMGLFGGQKQVGDAKGATLFEGAKSTSRAPQADAFFKFGGADQYADYLMDNAQDLKGGALDTSIFKTDFFSDPNRVANVFGETSQGRDATGQYKSYLQSQIRPGFDQPYRTERRQEGDMIYEYKIPIQEYFQNQYYNKLISDTPDVLKTGFSYDQFQSPTVNRSASEYKGEKPVKSATSPIFKSGVVNLFKKGATQPGQLAKQFLEAPAPVYQSSIKSGSYNIPEASKSVFQAPNVQSVQIPQITKEVIYKPKPKSSSSKSSSTVQKTISRANELAKTAITPKIAQSASQIKQQEQKQGGVKLSSGRIADVAPAREQSSAKIIRTPSTSKSNWLKELFKRIF